MNDDNSLCGDLIAICEKWKNADEEGDGSYIYISLKSGKAGTN